MLPTKGPAKRGRPKRKVDSDQESNQSFSRKPSKKVKAPSKKPPKLNSRPSKSKVEISSIQSFSDSEEPNKDHFVKVPLQLFNSDQIFAQILNKATKQPEYLMMLRNLLSGSSRLRQDKVNQFKKKWKALKNSNCSQQQYFSRQSELKRAQTEELTEIEEDILAKLALANIRGFETKESIIEQYKQKYREANQSTMEEQQEFIIDNITWEKYYQEQRRLLEMLMKEADLVSSDYKLINVTHSYSSQPITTNPHNSLYHPTSKQEQNEMDLKFNSLETQQNPQSTQFLFCKHFSNNAIDYNRVFDHGFKVSEDQKYYIDNKALSWLLESKCDEIYTNQRFQKETYEKYTAILKDIYERGHEFTDEQIMQKILESAAYVLNSVHYYQKFKLKCQLLHPLDLLLVVQKLAQKRKTQKKGGNQPTLNETISNIKQTIIDEQKQVGEIMNMEEERDY